MTDAAQTPPRQGCPGWAKALLIASLAVNLAVVGLFAGQMIKKDERRAGGTNQIEWILRFVPDERRDFTKAHFKSMRGDLKAAFQRRRENIEEILAAIRTEPFSTEGLQAAMDTRLAEKIERNRLVQNSLIELLEQFTPEERAEFADKLEAQLEKARARRQQL